LQSFSLIIRKIKRWEDLRGNVVVFTEVSVMNLHFWSSKRGLHSSRLKSKQDFSYSLEISSLTRLSILPMQFSSPKILLNLNWFQKFQPISSRKLMKTKLFSLLKETPETNETAVFSLEFTAKLWWSSFGEKFFEAVSLWKQSF
jgi:hypothetical protein